MSSKPEYSRAAIHSKKAEVDWTSPETLVILILAVLLGLAFLFYVIKLKGRLAP